MKKLRKYGKAAYTVAVIHGGPGARGDMAPVAKELSKTCGILEPLQICNSIGGQVEELNTVFKKYAKLPIILIGHSWGAWLSVIFTAKYPLFVKKLILVGSGPFEEKYVSKIMKRRLSRLSKEEKIKLDILMEEMNNPCIKDKNLIFTKFGELMSKTDSFKPILSNNKVEVQYEIFKGVWKEAEELRQSGKLLELGKKIKCPVVAIHGDCDPHPFIGIEKPLSQQVKDFQFILLKNFGHYPWLEHFAKEKFYAILKEETTDYTD
jgi:pimeloyl-ACP methyl ester carboxylesterase